MKFGQPSWRQRLAYATCAVALACSLAVYKRDVMANPLSVVQKHWDAIAAADLEQTATLYSNDAIFVRSQGVIDEVYQGESIYLAWQQFFSQHQIEEFRVINHKQRDHGVEAQIQITAKSNEGIPVVLSVSYQAQFDDSGKIIHEVWQVRPQRSI